MQSNTTDKSLSEKFFIKGLDFFNKSDYKNAKDNLFHEGIASHAYCLKNLLFSKNQKSLFLAVADVEQPVYFDIP